MEVLDIEKDIDSEKSEYSKTKLINHWVYLKSHSDLENIWAKVKIKEVNYKTSNVEIELNGKLETVKFSQLTVIPFVTDMMLAKLSNELDRIKKSWDIVDKDKKAMQSGSRCQWLYKYCEHWLIDPDWNTIAYNFNANAPDFDRFYTDIIELVIINREKNQKYFNERRRQKGCKLR